MVTAGDAGGRDSPPSSPRLRQTTFGATLDFIEALCDASSRLTSFPPVSNSHAVSCTGSPQLLGRLEPTAGILSPGHAECSTHAPTSAGSTSQEAL